MDARVVVCALDKKRVRVLLSNVFSKLERDREIMARWLCNRGQTELTLCVNMSRDWHRNQYLTSLEDSRSRSRQKMSISGRQFSTIY